MSQPRCLELCAGAGGQALGLERAGFAHQALVEIDRTACETLRVNRPDWNVLHCDVRYLSGVPYRGVDLLAAGVPCPPFSVAGKQLGERDERDLFPEALRIVEECRPRAVLFENVRGLLEPKFARYRAYLREQLEVMGYAGEWRLLYASDFGLAQLRPRALLVAFEPGESSELFIWPEPVGPPPSVGEALIDLMAASGWEGAQAWAQAANGVGPTLVGGSKRHGGADLGPSRARAAWASLGVRGSALADAPPGPGFVGQPRLTVRMTARLQGFPDTWRFSGRKTAAYRQVGNAFPPPVAEAVGRAIATALRAEGLGRGDLIHGSCPDDGRRGLQGVS